MMSKLKDYDPNFRKLWNDSLNTAQLNDTDIKLTQQSLIDEAVRTMMDELTVSEFMKFGHMADDFLVSEFFQCASDKLHPMQPCKNFANEITTAQDIGNCFTLFHRSRSEVLQKIAIDSGLSQSPVKRGKDNEAVNIEISEEPFHPNEILRLKLDFHSEEYTTLNEPVLGHIIIHDDDEAPVVREKSYMLEPGKYYEFFITKESDQLLPLPYATDCIDHRSTDSDGSDDLNEYLHHPLSRQNCIIGCMAQNTMDKCNCWPPELPFMRGTVDNAQENQMKWCDWDSNFALEKSANSTWFQFCFTIHENECNKKCKSDCSIDRYRITKEVRTWPATERIEHSKKSDYLSEMRRCCAIVSLRYWSAEQNINRYQPKFETAEFTSYIGGLLSMWLGFALLRVYDWLELVSIYFYRYFNEKRKTSALTTLPKNIPSIEVYDSRMSYDNHLRSEMRRKTWRRKAKVAAIIERMNPSPTQRISYSRNK